MHIYAIGDLHLPGHEEKPMNVFGDHWDRHFDIIRENWLRLVKPEDVVLIPGDISWAMQLTDALDDLNDIAELPGTKLLLRGNHDYWWSSIGKVRAALAPSMYAIQNDALVLGNYVFCGTRGWMFPTAQQPLNEQNEKIYQRELMRLEMSLARAAEIAEGRRLMVMLHYPPLFADGLSTGFTDILEQHPSAQVVYGHLHGLGIRIAFEGERNRVNYQLVSCDAIDFCPRLIAQDE